MMNLLMPSALLGPNDLPCAVTYLRVSTKEQAHRGGREEGYSLPDQRKAVNRKGEALGAVIVAEFIEPGESGKSLKNRKALQELLAFVAENHITYCIVPKVDRLARNRLDDALIHAELVAHGVTLVSAAEHIDDTPAGTLNHGIMAAIAEFYSANLATEVTKGLRTKATTGGTIGRAPIGYRNIRVLTESGHELRTVELDPDRAPLIKLAFESYATGDWTLNTLLDELTARGLTSSPTPKRPAKPIHVSTLHRTLQNPYYKGVIVYDGLEHDATHEPLVPVDVWDQVQSVLRANNLAGDKTQTHDHYLKGSLYCDNCESRLLLTHAKNKHGVVYPYFICAGRHAKRTDCRRKAMHVDRIEQLVIDHYAHVQLDPATLGALQATINEEFAIINAQAKYEAEDLTRQQRDLRNQRDKLMHAHYAGAVPLDQLKTEQERITGQLDYITTRLDDATANYAAAQAELSDCLDLLTDYHTVYQQAPDAVRRLFNQALFARIYITNTDDVRTEKAGPFAILLDEENQRSARLQQRDNDQPRVQTPAHSQADGCLNMKRWVEPRRFELLTSCLQSRRSTN